MTEIAHLQQKNVCETHILELLIYFKEFRGFSNRELAQKIHYRENYLTHVRNGDVIGGEKLLHALETFFQLDTLKQIQDIDRQILELQTQKGILTMQTVEQFYAERRAGKEFPHQTTPPNPELNERPGTPTIGAPTTKSARSRTGSLRSSSL